MALLMALIMAYIMVKYHYEYHSDNRQSRTRCPTQTGADALQISPGDSLELESSEDRIILRPARGNARVYKKQGMWVLHSDTPYPANIVEDTIRRVRRERERAILGKNR